MHAGKLRHRLVVERLTESQSATTGEVADAWAAVATYWALVEPLAGDELFESRQVAPEITHKVTLRYGADVTTADRITWGSRTFGILAMIDVGERREQLELSCKELT